MVAGCAAVVIAIAAIVGILTGGSRHDRGRTAVNETGFDPAASDSNTTLSNATPDSIGIYQRMTRGGRENDPS
jgi:hypothetical protein